MSDKTFPVLEGAPYFNFELRQFLIEGSHSIIPSKPIEVAGTRQLLMDKHLVDSSWNLFRTVHQPDKHPSNPLIPGGLWESDGYRVEADCGCVMYDDELGRFRFWTILRDSNRKRWDADSVHVYWESEDGVRWTKPELGIVEFEGSKANNVIQAGAGLIYGGLSVIKTPPRLASKGRFAMVYGLSREHFLPGLHHGMETRIAWSPDGLHWQDQPENPIIAGRNDTFVNMVYDPERDVFMQYRRATVNSHEVRRMACSESRDLVSWTQPEVIFDADELDAPMLYDFSVNRYEGIYIGFLHSLYGTNAGYKTGARIWKDGRIEKDHHVDVQLAWSRDGKHWERHPQRPIFLENGILTAETKYDWGMVFACQGIIEKDDRLHLYYRGDSNLHMTMKPGQVGNFCLATLRKDGFVSLGTPEKAIGPGYMLTRPLLCPGGRLHVNARTRKDGLIRVAVRDGDGVRDGCWLEGWNFEDGQPFSGDSIDALVQWKGKKSFNALKGQAVRLHFWLQDAELFSFWFE